MDKKTAQPAPSGPSAPVVPAADTKTAAAGHKDEKSGDAPKGNEAEAKAKQKGFDKMFKTVCDRLLKQRRHSVISYPVDDDDGGVVQLSYTAGVPLLLEGRLDPPVEFAVLGLPPDVATEVLNSAVDAALAEKDPVDPHALVGKTWDAIANVPLLVRRVDSIDKHFGMARKLDSFHVQALGDHYKSGFVVLQLLWPDKDGRYPAADEPAPLQPFW